jgi:hypothetical protein
MARVKGHRLETYSDTYRFTPQSLIRKEGERMWIPQLFCHRGHVLTTEAVRFDGLPAVHIVAQRAGEPAQSCYLSPIFDDARKLGFVYPEGTQLRLFCPECHDELRPLVPCTCQPGAFRRAVYLTPDPAQLGAVGICDVYGCPQSFVTEDGELLFEVVHET